jgi:hypothetical protein
MYAILLIYQVVYLDQFMPETIGGFTQAMVNELKGVGMWNEFTISRDGEVNYRVLSCPCSINY